MTTNTTTKLVSPILPEKQRVPFRGILGKLIAGIFKTVLLALLIAVITPLVFYAWRSSQPMVLPQYNGMSYFELLQARSDAMREKAVTYQNAHTEKTVPLDMCFRNETFWSAVVFPVVGAVNFYFYFRPEQYYLHKASYEDYVVPTTVAEIFPAWWENYEMILWGNYTHTNPVVYCNIAPPVGP